MTKMAHNGAALALQLDDYRAYPDLAVNGRRTRSENVARLSRASIAWVALAALTSASLLAGCGPDVVGAAAGGAAAAAADARQAQEQKARAQQQIKALEKAQQDRLDNVDKQVDRGAQ
jgi:hypothetical protein